MEIRMESVKRIAKINKDLADYSGSIEGEIFFIEHNIISRYSYECYLARMRNDENSRDVLINNIDFCWNRIEELKELL